MSSIEHIVGREVLDSRGNPTVEVEVSSASGAPGAGDRAVRRAHRPVRGRRAARRRRPLRRQGRDHRRGLRQRRDRATPSSASTRSTSARSTQLLDLDGTDNKARLGANAILGVSLAVAKAAADELGLPLYRYVGGTNAHVLPVPMMNVLNGGAHADNNVDFQEFMVMPVGAARASPRPALGRRDLPRAQERSSTTASCPPPSATRAASRPNLGSNEEALQLLVEAIEQAGYTPGRRHRPGARRGVHRVLRRRQLPARGRGPHAVAGTSSASSPSWASATRSCRSRTACAEEDWDGWAGLTADARRPGPARGRRPVRDQRRAPGAGHRAGVANSILVKVNQIGSLTETLDAVGLATSSGYTSVMSHRSGETEDTTIADLAVATNCGQIKTGARRGATVSPSTTSCCASRTTWVRPRPSGAAPRCAVGARAGAGASDDPGAADPGSRRRPSRARAAAGHGHGPSDGRRPGGARPWAARPAGPRSAVGATPDAGRGRPAAAGPALVGGDVSPGALPRVRRPAHYASVIVRRPTPRPRTAGPGGGPTPPVLRRAAAPTGGLGRRAHRAGSSGGRPFARRAASRPAGAARSAVPAYGLRRGAAPAFEPAGLVTATASGAASRAGAARRGGVGTDELSKPESAPTGRRSGSVTTLPTLPRRGQPGEAGGGTGAIPRRPRRRHRRPAQEAEQAEAVAGGSTRATAARRRRGRRRHRRRRHGRQTTTATIDSEDGGAGPLVPWAGRWPHRPGRPGPASPALRVVRDVGTSRLLPTDPEAREALNPRLRRAGTYVGAMAVACVLIYAVFPVRTYLDQRAATRRSTSRSRSSASRTTDWRSGSRRGDRRGDRAHRPRGLRHGPPGRGVLLHPPAARLPTTTTTTTTAPTGASDGAGASGATSSTTVPEP